MPRLRQSLVAISVVLAAAAVQADIFQWEYIDPDDPSQGKRQSTMLAPGGAGVDAVPGAQLGSRNLTMAYLIGADLTSANASFANLTDADLNQANLTNASFHDASLTGAVFTGADVRGADFSETTARGFTAAQLYSTASYQAYDLSGIRLGGYRPYANDLAGWNFAGQNLANANFRRATLTAANLSQANLANADFVVATLTGADFTNAMVRGANFDRVWKIGTSATAEGTGISLDQLYSTASFQVRDLSGIRLRDHNLAGANFADQNLTNASFFSATLTGADFTGAEVREADFSNFDGTGITLAQLYSTASYQAHVLTGIRLGGNFAGGNFAGQNLMNASIGGPLMGADFREANLNNASLGGNLSGANFHETDLINARLGGNLSGANFREANLTNANFEGVTLTGADFTGAEVRGANFSRRFDYNTNMYVGGLTLAQLYSTASYHAHDLSAIGLVNINLSGGKFAGQYLTNADLAYTTLTGADFTGAEIRGAIFRYAPGLTAAQLYSTASYQAHDLTGIDLGGINIAGANFVGQNLANAVFYYGKLAGADFTAADARGALFHDSNPITGATTTNLIRPDGHITGLNLDAGGLLVVRDYDGGSPHFPHYGVTIPITVDQQLAMAPGGTLRMVFEADTWDSTISFAPDIPVTLGGTLELTFADDVNPAIQVGRTFHLFDWNGVHPTGAFAISSLYTWDLSNLYTTGEVTLAAVPEPASIALTAAVFGLILLRRRPSMCNSITDSSLRNSGANS